MESPTASVVMTEPTPMIRPSMVKSERRRLLQRTASASTRNSRSLFMAQTIDRRKPRRSQRRIRTEEDADENGKTERNRDDRHPRHAARATRKFGDEKRARARAGQTAKKRAYRTAEQRDGGRFDEELDEYVARRSADGLANPDLARSFVHRDEHHVHHADAAHEQGDAADR